VFFAFDMTKKNLRLHAPFVFRINDLAWHWQAVALEAGRRSGRFASGE